MRIALIIALIITLAGCGATSPYQAIAGAWVVTADDTGKAPSIPLEITFSEQGTLSRWAQGQMISSGTYRIIEEENGLKLGIIDAGSGPESEELIDITLDDDTLVFDLPNVERNIILTRKQ